MLPASERRAPTLPRNAEIYKQRPLKAGLFRGNPQSQTLQWVSNGDYGFGLADAILNSPEKEFVPKLAYSVLSSL